MSDNYTAPEPSDVAEALDALNRDVTSLQLTQVQQEYDLTGLLQRVESLEKERPGRRMRPLLASDPGVCGLDPENSSDTCEGASIYRYQQGCRGDACVKVNREYYAEYRRKNRAASASEVSVAVD
jgi:hypothetical protein